MRSVIGTALITLVACGGAVGENPTGTHTHFLADDHELQMQHTYALLEADVPEGFYDEHHQELFGAVHDRIHDEMQQRNRVETPEGEADLIVSYTVGGRSHPVAVRTAMLGSQPMEFPAHEEKMVIAIFERANGKKVFEASYDHLVDEDNTVEENEALIRGVITDMFAHFPPAEGEPPTAGGEAPVESPPAPGVEEEAPEAMEEEAPQA